MGGKGNMICSKCRLQVGILHKMKKELKGKRYCDECYNEHFNENNNDHFNDISENTSKAKKGGE